MISDIKVEVCIFAFDMLYLNGQTLLQEQLIVRKQHLYESFEEEPGYFQFSTAMTSTDLEEIQTFFENSVDASCEGLIIKTLSKDATYEPSKRSNNWLKLKKYYMESPTTAIPIEKIQMYGLKQLTEVWEVKAADLTISPFYCAAIGIVDSGKGISLRNPRLVRLREDKTPQQASSSDMVADMYNAQKHTQKDIKDNNEDE